MGKVRRIDFYPEDFWGGVTTQFTAEQIGVYWMVCTRIYSTGGPIQDDAARIAKWFDKGHHRSIRAALDVLIQAGKLFQCDADGDPNGTGYLFQSRCDTMLKEAAKRIDTYRDNGSKPKKKRNEIIGDVEASAFPVASVSASPSPPPLPPSSSSTIPPISPKGDDPALPDDDGFELAPTQNRRRAASSYVFEGHMIRLTQKDFDAWQKAYSNIDVMAELQSLDDYFRTNPPRGKWFNAASNMLLRKHNQARQASKGSLLDDGGNNQQPDLYSF